jgi:DNA-binding MarR family transcriptional regulator
MERPKTPSTLRDPRAIRALAHPIRLRLLETLGIEGTLTATRASELLGESPASCSFHLRQLARYGFVEEADTEARGRERPWRLTEIGFRIDEDASETAEALAAGALAALLDDRWLERAERWRVLRQHHPVEWRKALAQSQHLVWVTPEEAHALLDDINDLIATRYRHRITDPAARPQDALPIEILVRSHPFRLEGDHQ